MSEEIIMDGTVRVDTEEETHSPSIMQVSEEPVREDSEAEQTQRKENQEQHDTSGVTEDSEEEKQNKIITDGTVRKDTEEETQSPSILKVAEDPVTEDSKEEHRQREQNQEQHEPSAVSGDSEEENQSKMMTSQSEDDKEEVVKDIDTDIKSDDKSQTVELESIKFEMQEENEQSSDSSESSSSEDDKYIPAWEMKAPVEQGTVFQNVGRLRDRHAESLHKEEKQGDTFVKPVDEHIGYEIPDRTIYQNYEPPAPPVPARPKSEVARQPPPVPEKSIRDRKSFPSVNVPPAVPEKSFRGRSSVSPPKVPPAIPVKSWKLPAADMNTKSNVPERSLGNEESKKEKEEMLGVGNYESKGFAKETPVLSSEASSNAAAEDKTESDMKQEKELTGNTVKNKISMFENKAESKTERSNPKPQLQAVSTEEQVLKENEKKTMTTSKDSDSDEEFHSMDDDEAKNQLPPMEQGISPQDDFPSYEKASDSYSLSLQSDVHQASEKHIPTPSSENVETPSTNLQSNDGGVVLEPGSDATCPPQNDPTDGKQDVYRRPNVWPVTKDDDLEHASELTTSPLNYSSTSFTPETPPFTTPQLDPKIGHGQQPQYTSPQGQPCPPKNDPTDGKQDVYRRPNVLPVTKDDDLEHASELATSPSNYSSTSFTPETPPFTTPQLDPKIGHGQQPQYTNPQGQPFASQQYGQNQDRPMHFPGYQPFQQYEKYPQHTPSTFASGINPQGNLGGHFTSPPAQGPPQYQGYFRGLLPHYQGQGFRLPPTGQGQPFCPLPQGQGQGYGPRPPGEFQRFGPQPPGQGHQYGHNYQPQAPRFQTQDEPSFKTPPSEEKSKLDMKKKSKPKKSKLKKEKKEQKEQKHRNIEKKGTKDQEPEPCEDPCYVCVRGIDPQDTLDYFVNMLEAKGKSSVDNKSIVYGEDKTVAVARFEEKPDFNSLKKNLQKKSMKVCEVAPPMCVIVSVKREMPTDDTLKQYFGEMGSVKSVKMAEQGTRKVHFHDTESVLKVCENGYHKIDSEELFVSRYFDTEYGEVWEQEKHFVALPADLPLTDIDHFKKSLIRKSMEIQTLLNNKLEKDFAKVKVTEELHIECTLEQTTDNVRNLVKVWKSNVLQIWQEFVEEATHKVEMVVSSEIWHHLHEQVKKERVHDDLHVDISEDGEDIKLVFVGIRDLTETVTKNIKEEKTKIEAEVQRKKEITNDMMKLSALETRLLLRTDVMESIKDIADDLEAKCDGDSGEITFTGVAHDINQAKAKILQRKGEFKKFQLQCESDNEQDGIHKDQIDMLKAHKRDILSQFEKKNLRVEVEFEENNIHGCVLQESEKSEVENILRSTVKRSVRTFKSEESKAVLRQWNLKREIKKINNEFNEDMEKVRISLDGSKSQIILTSMSDIHEDLLKRVENFVHTNAVYKKSISVTDKGKMEFLNRHCITELKEDLMEFSVDINLSDNSIELSGNKEGLKKAETEVTTILKGMVSKKHEISRLGIESVVSPDKKDFFKPVEKDTKSVVMFQDTAEDASGFCYISDSDEDDYARVEVSETWRSVGAGNTKENVYANTEPMFSPLLKKGTYKCRHGTTITLVKGELGKQEADVLVCSTSKELNLSGGKAGKNLLTCGGASLQDDCKSNFPDGIEHGSVAGINPGKLSCQKVYLGTLPDWSKEQTKTTKVITKFMKKCLSEAAAAGYKSICFSSMGTGGLKYPPQKAAHLMYDAVISYDSKHSSCVRDVRFVLYPGDYVVVDAFEREEYYRLNPSAKPSLVKAAKLKGPFNTGKGIKITMVTDLLDNQTVDVIACAVDNKMSFGSGASKALRDKAGSETLLAECKTKYPNGIKFAQVLELNGGTLKCKQIFVTLLPDFRSEEEIVKTRLTDKTMYRVITEMLTIAVRKGFTSISLPAMGTGQLHYPSHFVAHLMYNCVVDFSTKNPNTCLTDVRFIIHPKDIKNVKAFENEEQLHLTPPEVYSSGTKSFRTKSSNINVSIETGSIAKFAKADVIVCPVSDNLDLSQGQTSQSLLMEDGDYLQQECRKQYPQGIKLKEIAKIKPKKMPCKQVYFITLPKCTPGNEVESETTFIETTKQILDQATQDGFFSVALSSMGTGYNKYPHDRAACLSYLAVTEFDKSHPRSSVKNVYFVILPRDVKSLEAFKEEERKRTKSIMNFPLLSAATPRAPPPSTRLPSQGAVGGEGAKTKRTFVIPEDDGNIPRRPDRRKRPSRKMTRKMTVNPSMTHSIQIPSKPHEFHFGKVSLKIVQGNIVELRDKLDVLVNCTDTNMDFQKGAVTADILAKCDKKKLDTEAGQKKAEMKQSGITHTSDCGLNCKIIIHVASQDTLKDWQAMLVKCFQMADDLGHTSLALPAVGTDPGFTVLNCEDMAKVIHDSLVMFTSLGRDPKLQSVRLVVSDKDMRWPMNEKIRKCSEELPKSSEYMQTITENLSMFGPLPNTELRSSVSLWILSDSNSNIQNAIKMIEKLIQDKYITKEFPETIIKDLTKEEVNHIEQLQKKFPIKVKVDQQKSMVVLEGFPEYVGNAKDKLYQFCSKCQYERFQDGEAEIIKDMVQWYYKEKNSKGLLELLEYPPRINMGLENTRKGNFKTYCFNSDGDSYVIDVEDMKEYLEKDKNDPSKHVDVLRREKLQGGNYDLPEYWDPMPNEDEIVKLFQLQPTTQEYTDLEKMFTTSVVNGKFKGRFNAANLKVHKIERIQNPTLYKQYACKKAEMEKYFQPGTTTLEQVLWHGTPEASVVSINYYGFNRSYCGKNGTWYGAGVYFANDASYSARDWVSPKNAGQKQIIYQARVLTGEFIKGTPAMRVLPPIPTNPARNYDSAVDDANNPLEFAIFNDTQAYPEYCIYFTT